MFEYKIFTAANLGEIESILNTHGADKWRLHTVFPSYNYYVVTLERRYGN